MIMIVERVGPSIPNLAHIDCPVCGSHLLFNGADVELVTRIKSKCVVVMPVICCAVCGSSINVMGYVDIGEGDDLSAFFN